MKTLALLTPITLVVIFFWHLRFLIKEFNESPTGQDDDNDSIKDL